MNIAHESTRDKYTEIVKNMLDVKREYDEDNDIFNSTYPRDINNIGSCKKATIPYWTCRNKMVKSKKRLDDLKDQLLKYNVSDTTQLSPEVIPFNTCYRIDEIGVLEIQIKQYLQELDTKLKFKLDLARLLSENLKRKIDLLNSTITVLSSKMQIMDCHDNENHYYEYLNNMFLNLKLFQKNNKYDITELVTYMNEIKHVTMHEENYKQFVKQYIDGSQMYISYNTGGERILAINSANAVTKYMSYQLGNESTTNLVIKIERLDGRQVELARFPEDLELSDDDFVDKMNQVYFGSV